jgi:hypothetical protein
MERFMKEMKTLFVGLGGHLDDRFASLENEFRKRVGKLESKQAALQAQVKKLLRRNPPPVVPPAAASPPASPPKVVMFHRTNIHCDRVSKAWLREELEELSWESADELCTTRWRAGKKVHQCPRGFYFFVDEHFRQVKYANIAVVGTRLWVYQTPRSPWKEVGGKARFLKAFLDECRDAYLLILKNVLGERDAWVSCFRPHHDAMSRMPGCDLLSVAALTDILHRYLHLAQENRTWAGRSSQACLPNPPQQSKRLVDQGEGE